MSGKLAPDVGAEISDFFSDTSQNDIQDRLAHVWGARDVRFEQAIIFVLSMELHVPIVVCEITN